MPKSPIEVKVVGVVEVVEFEVAEVEAEVAELTALGELLEGSIDVPVTNTSSEDVSIQEAPSPPQDMPVEE